MIRRRTDSRQWRAVAKREREGNNKRWISYEKHTFII